MRGVLSTAEFDLLATAGDCNEGQGKTEQGHMLRKCAKGLLEYDRTLWLRQHGFEAHISRMIPREASPKNHIIYAWPKAGAQDIGSAEQKTSLLPRCRLDLHSLQLLTLSDSTDPFEYINTKHTLNTTTTTTSASNSDPAQKTTELKNNNMNQIEDIKHLQAEFGYEAWLVTDNLMKEFLQVLENYELKETQLTQSSANTSVEITNSQSELEIPELRFPFTGPRQRKLQHAVAASYGLWHRSEGKGKLRAVVARKKI